MKQPIDQWDVDRVVPLTKKAEGYSSKAYRCPAGVPTIGWGHTKGVKMGMTCTRPKAESWLMEDLETARDQAARVLGGIHTTEGQALAITDFVFNLGVTRFRASTLCKMIKAGDFEGAADQFGRWVYAGDKKLPGLVERREQERLLFTEEM